MKKLNSLKDASLSTWIGACTLSLLSVSPSVSIAALNCPPGQSANSSGGCSISDGYTPGDQGSVAQEHLNSYYQNKALFTAYQKEWDEWNNKNLQLVQTLNKPIVHQYQLLALRLAKWHREDVNSFNEYFKYVKTTIPIDLVRDIPHDLSREDHRNFMMAFVMDAYASGKNSLLVSQYNTNLRKIAQLYFQMNPTAMKSIHIHYWPKAYAPSISGKWGFTASYSDAMSLIDLQKVYPFIRPSDASDYDFSQAEESFSDTWNNADTSPSAKTTKSTRYYKFVPQALPKAFSDSLTERISPALVAHINNETLAHTQSNVVGFRFNTLMGSFLAANTDHQERSEHAANLALAFPRPAAVSQVSRVINLAKGTCLAPAKSEVSAEKINLEYRVETQGCDAGTRALDWYVIENEDKTIQLKNAFSGQCLTSPRQAFTGPVTLVCGGRINTYEPIAQNWQWTGDNRLRRLGMDRLYSLTVMAPSDYSTAAKDGRELDVYPYDYLRGKEASRAKWMVNTGYMRDQLLTAENYKTAEALGKNFLAVMYSFTEELAFMERMKSVNAGTNLPAEDSNRRLEKESYTAQERAKSFFDKIYSNTELYNQLPTSIKDFIFALHTGTSLLDAYSQQALAIYEDVQKAHIFKPTAWDDETNVAGSLHVYENPTNNSVEIFISNYNGNPASSRKYIPLNKKSNENWIYVTSLGNREQVKNLLGSISNNFSQWGKSTSYGEIFHYDNPVSKKLEFFQATFKGMANNSAAYFPTNQTSNDKWRYLGQQNSADVLLAALANDINTAYFSYMYNLVKLNIGSKHTIPNLEHYAATTESDQDGFEFDNWITSVAPANNPSYGSAGQGSLGQHFYASTPTITSMALYMAPNVGALGALSNALLNVKFGVLPAFSKSELLLQRALIRQQFEEMMNPRYNQILGELGIDPINQSPDELFNYPVSPRFIFEEWSEGRLNPPENFEQFRSNFRSLFREGSEGDIDFNSYLETQLDDAASLNPANQGLLALSNNSLSNAFNALTITESSIAVSTVSVSAAMSTIIGLGL